MSKAKHYPYETRLNVLCQPLEIIDETLGARKATTINMDAWNGMGNLLEGEAELIT